MARKRRAITPHSTFRNSLMTETLIMTLKAKGEELARQTKLATEKLKVTALPNHPPRGMRAVGGGGTAGGAPDARAAGIQGQAAGRGAGAVAAVGVMRVVPAPTQHRTLMETHFAIEEMETKKKELEAKAALLEEAVATISSKSETTEQALLDRAVRGGTGAASQLTCMQKEAELLNDEKSQLALATAELEAHLMVRCCSDCGRADVRQGNGDAGQGAGD